MQCQNRFVVWKSRCYDFPNYAIVYKKLWKFISYLSISNDIISGRQQFATGLSGQSAMKFMLDQEKATWVAFEWHTISRTGTQSSFTSIGGSSSRSSICIRRQRRSASAFQQLASAFPQKCTASTVYWSICIRKQRRFASAFRPLAPAVPQKCAAKIFYFA